MRNRNLQPPSKWQHVSLILSNVIGSRSPVYPWSHRRLQKDSSCEWPPLICTILEIKTKTLKIVIVCLWRTTINPRPINRTCFMKNNALFQNEDISVKNDIVCFWFCPSRRGLAWRKTAGLQYLFPESLCSDMLFSSPREQDLCGGEVGSGKTAKGRTIWHASRAGSKSTEARASGLRSVVAGVAPDRASWREWGPEKASFLGESCPETCDGWLHRYKASRSARGICPPRVHVLTQSL